MKLLTGCQTESLLLIFTLPLVFFFFFISLLSSLWRNPTLSLSLFPSLASLQVDCCSRCRDGVQSLQISAEHRTVQPGSFWKCSIAVQLYSHTLLLTLRSPLFLAGVSNSLHLEPPAPLTFYWANHLKVKSKYILSIYPIGSKTSGSNRTESCAQ